MVMKVSTVNQMYLVNPNVVLSIGTISQKRKIHAHNQTHTQTHTHTHTPKHTYTHKNAPTYTNNTEEKWRKNTKWACDEGGFGNGILLNELVYMREHVLRSLTFASKYCKIGKDTKLYLTPLSHIKVELSGRSIDSRHVTWGNGWQKEEGFIVWRNDIL